MRLDRRQYRWRCRAAGQAVRGDGARGRAGRAPPGPVGDIRAESRPSRSKRKISPPLRPSQPELGAREGSGAERGARVELHAAEQDRWTGARLVGGVVTQRTASGYNEVSHADGRRQLCKGVQWSVAESRLAASRGAPLHRCEGANGRGERRVRWNLWVCLPRVARPVHRELGSSRRPHQQCQRPQPSSMWGPAAAHGCKRGPTRPDCRLHAAACRSTRALDVASDPATPAQVRHADTAPRRRDGHDLGS